MIEWIEWMNEREKEYNIVLYSFSRSFIQFIHSFNNKYKIIIRDGGPTHLLPNQVFVIYSALYKHVGWASIHRFFCLAQAVWQCKFCCRFWISLPYMSRLSHLTAPCSFARLKLQLFLWLLLAAISDFQSDSIFNMFVSTVLFFKVNWVVNLKPRPGVEAQQIF